MKKMDVKLINFDLMFDGFDDFIDDLEKKKVVISN